MPAGVLINHHASAQAAGRPASRLVPRGAPGGVRPAEASAAGAGWVWCGSVECHTLSERDTCMRVGPSSVHRWWRAIDRLGGQSTGVRGRGTARVAPGQDARVCAAPATRRQYHHCAGVVGHCAFAVLLACQRRLRSSCRDMDRSIDLPAGRPARAPSLVVGADRAWELGRVSCEFSSSNKHAQLP